jgi:hypothetical protein
MTQASTALLSLSLNTAAWLALAGSAFAQEGAMTFFNECRGNSAANCFVVAVGEIQPDSAARFLALMAEGVDGNRVLFDSPGGNLQGGMELGRAIRDQNMETEVGRWQSDGITGDVVPGATCASACAYAFLGGAIRRVPEGNQLGFHQFYIDPALVPAQIAGDALIKAMDETQRLSGEIVAYVIEMNVDARIFGLGSQAGAASMVFPDEATMLDYDLITPDGFGPFFMEPYGNGVIAASRRLGPTRLYDEMTQLTALCKAGTPTFLLTAEGSFEGVEGGEVTVNGGKVIAVPTERTAVIGDTAYQLQFTAADAAAIVAADSLELWIWRAPYLGGEMKATFTPSKMDRAMIAAAFRFCI